MKIRKPPKEITVKLESSDIESKTDEPTPTVSVLNKELGLPHKKSDMMMGYDAHNDLRVSQ